MNALAPITVDADLLYGVPAISEHLGMTAKQVYHLHDQRHLPTFKIGGKVCARRSELEIHFARVSLTGHGGPKRRAMPEAGSEQATATPSVSSPPIETAAVLYGHRAIAAHLGLSSGDVARLDVERRLPTYLDDGCTIASTAALDHWNSTKGGR